MKTVNVEDLPGSCLWSGVRVTALLTIDCTVVIGTDRGSVLAFTHLVDDVEIGSAAACGSSIIDCDCVYARALHYGPVHCLAVSSTYLIASAGHDATVCVQPLAGMLAHSEEKLVRLHGHTLAVSSTAFFSNGSWLATCSIGGHFIVFDTSSHACLCQLRIGFPVRCLALALDETACYVGGTQLVRVDLYDNDRPLEPLIQRQKPSWSQRYSWDGDADAGAGEVGDEGPTGECAGDLFVAELHVNEECLIAIFKSRRDAICGGAVATWRHDTADCSHSSDFKRLATASQLESVTMLRRSRPTQSSRLRICVDEDERGMVRGAGLVYRSRDGWDTWRTGYVRVRQRGVAQRLVWSPSVRSALSLSSAAYSQLGLEEERERRLRMECEELVDALKATGKVSGKRRRSRVITT